MATDKRRVQSGGELVRRLGRCWREKDGVTKAESGRETVWRSVFSFSLSLSGEERLWHGEEAEVSSAKAGQAPGRHSPLPTALSHAAPCPTVGSSFSPHARIRCFLNCRECVYLNIRVATLLRWNDVPPYVENFFAPKL